MKKILLFICGLVILLLLIGLCVQYTDYPAGTTSNIQINGELYNLGEMTVHRVAKASQSNIDDQSEVTTDLAEVKKTLGVDALICPFRSQGNAEFRLTTEWCNWAIIEAEDDILVNDYITQNTDRVSNDEPKHAQLTWKAELILDPKQFDQSSPKEYLGDYITEGMYSILDIPVLVIRTPIDSISPRYICVFIHDGIRYTYSAQISLDVMKEIIKSTLIEFE